MDNQTYRVSDNIITLERTPRRPLTDNPVVSPDSGPADARVGSKEDPRMREALALMEAFLAIEDKDARGAVVTLAQQLVSHDWARRTQGR